MNEIEKARQRRVTMRLAGVAMGLAFALVIALARRYL
jgi:hypothetical protein